MFWASFLKKSAQVLVIALWVTQGVAKEVQGVRVWPSAENTRVVFDLSDKVDYTIFALNDPHRIVIDIQQAQFKAKLMPQTWENANIKKIRYSQFNAHTLRIVFDLEKETKISSFLLSPEQTYGHRLVVDLGKASSISTVASKTPIKMTASKFIIAIDAGHGGQDPGAIGKAGRIQEKEVVLSVAKKLQHLINATPGMQAHLVRKGDYYIGLRKRMELARKEGADLFISIHADSFNDPKASGASVYVLSEKGASNEAARWLAERENRADLIGGIRLEGKGDLLASVLFDLSQTASQTASDSLAGHLITQLGKVTDLHHKTVQRAGFLVLKSPDIPSVLVELGFLSNPKSEEKLAKDAHHQALAKALFNGINSYFALQPKPLKHINEQHIAHQQTVRRV